MNIRIDGKGFNFEEHRFIYNLYFIEHDTEFDAPTAAGIFKKILIKWAEILQGIGIESSKMFLPFDQWTDCLMATLVGDKIALNFVRVADSGWGVFDYDLKGFITSPHEIRDKGPELGQYSKDEIISALFNAELIED